MSWFHSKESSTIYGTIIDIQSGSIGILIVESNHTKTLPKILYSERVPIRFTEKEPSQKQSLRHMREALFSASLLLSREGLRALTQHNKKARIRKILISCATPWAYTVAKTVAFSGDNEIRVTRTLIDDLIASAEEEIESQTNELVRGDDLSLSIIERATIDVRINDYAVQNPIGLKGTSLALSHITGLLPVQILEAVYEVQSKILQDTTARAHTLMLMTFCVLRDLLPKTSTATIVHITEETTEFGVIENNTLVACDYVPYGSSTCIRELALETQKTQADILARLQAFSENKLSQKNQSDIESHMKKYSDAISDMIKKLSRNGKLSKTLIFTSHTHIPDAFKNELTRIVEEITNNTTTLLSVDGTLFPELLESSKPDVYFSIISRFFHKLHGCGEMNVHK